MRAANIVSRMLFRMVGCEDRVIHPASMLDVLAAESRQGLGRER
jgi:hypothetical protein